MKLAAFKLQNYRAIEDTGLVWLGHPITILAGRNGSGKSAIVEALNSIDGSWWRYPEDAQPVGSRREPTLTMIFDVTEDDIEMVELISNLVAPIPLKVKEDWLADGVEVQFTKSTCDLATDLEQYDLSGSDERDSARSKYEALFKRIKDSWAKGQQIYYHSDHDVFKLFSITERLSDHAQTLKAAVKEQGRRDVEELKALSQRVYEHTPGLMLRDAVIKCLPSIVRIVDTGPAQSLGIPIESYKSDRFLAAALSYSNLSVAKLRDLGFQPRSELLRAASQRLNALFGSVLDDLDVLFELDYNSDHFLYGLKRNGSWLNGNQISSGTSAYLSAIVQTAVAARLSDTVVLFDEPGNALHASLQRELLDRMLELQSQCTIVYTTHSPYMIPVAHLDCIRLCTPTQVSKLSKSLSTGRHVDMMKPILDAVGFDIASSMTPFSVENVIVEGLSDYIYLKAVGRVVDIPFGLTPCLGATNASLLASIFEGWRLSYAILFDGDQRLKKPKQRRGSNRGSLEEKTVHLPAPTIEDMFCVADFDAMMTEVSEVTRRKSESNSALLKRSGLGKVLLAEVFLRRVICGATVADETLTRFRQVVRDINEIFGRTA